jgi:hypothetical protein
MDGFVDILSAIFEQIGDERPERPEFREQEQPVFVYERYLCGGPKYLNINDR